jgi:hypothetical protein
MRAMLAAGVLLAQGSIAQELKNSRADCDNGLWGTDQETNPLLWFDAMEWAFRESIPVGLTRTAAVATPDGNIHVVCGNTMLPETSYSREEIYSPGEDTWIIGDLQHPAAPGGVHNHDVEIIGNKIWVGGGSRISDYYDNLTVIDLIANTWTVVGPMPVSSHTYYEFAAGSDGKLYMFGGATPDNYNYAFDTTTRTWAARAAMPVALRDPAAVGVGDTIYLFGGYTDAGGTAPTNATRAYSIAGNNWTAKANVPTARGWATANVVFTVDSGPMIYVIGGTNGSSPLTTVERYSVLTGTWATQTPLQKLRRSHAAVTIGDTTFVVCGWEAARPMPFIKSLERGFDPLLVTAVGEKGVENRKQVVLSVFPNPCSRETKINVESGMRSAERLGLYDATGVRVRSLRITGAQTLSTSDLKSGVYWLRSVAGTTTPVKVVVQE